MIIIVAVSVWFALLVAYVALQARRPRWTYPRPPIRPRLVHRDSDAA